jgi:hypothetical protein
VEQTTGPGIARGQGGEVVLTGSDGRRYVLESLEPAALRRQLRKDLREAEALLRSRRAPPVEAIQAHLRDLAAFPTLQAEFLDRAWRDMKARDAPVGDREIRDWLDSHEGMVWSMTRALRRRHPELTEDEVADLLDDVGIAEMQRARDLAAHVAVQEAGVGGEPGNGTPPPTTPG